ncbi:MAG TPA: amino acid adenylation domain-containing protein [Thermoanaerobaculia bacterium]|nr:amino acid adenylation domain-containing protein [Thermoanaerobaculia bacterium]
MSAPQSFVDVVRTQADRLGEKRAFTFLADGEEPAEHLTYAGLDRRAREIGADLQRRGAAGERVLLLFPPGLDFVAAFLGCLYAGAVAVPAYPPSPGRGTGRLRGLLQDARPRLALTVSASLERVERELAGAFEAVAMDIMPSGLAEDWRPPAAGPSTLAFLQYTSGSTSTPKGVRITHGNLLANERAIQRAFGQSEESVVAGWLPLYHDMGLIGNVLQPIWCGGSCVLMSPLAFLQKPSRWLEAVSRFRATTSGGPDFAYALCVRKVPPAARAGLDLSSWRVAYNGAEPVRAATLDAFAEAFAPSGFRRQAFYPCYGLAEATLFVSGGDPDSQPIVRSEEGKPLVGCGRAWPGERLAIVDPETGMALPDGREGEVWVAGPSVADGYWNRPEETERTFGVRLAKTGEGPFLRTGDLGLLDAQGELFVTGRLKDLIVVRGRNLYPHDLERTAEESHPALRPGGAAAFSVEAGGAERLVVVAEVERRREAESAAAVEAVRTTLVREHEVAPWEVVPIRAGTLPKTSSGKVRRTACREEYLAGGLTRLSSPLPFAAEGAGVRTLAAHLLRVAPESLDPDAPLPVDSLLALELKNRLESDLGIQVSLRLLLEGVSLRRLEEEAESLSRGILTPWPPLPSPTQPPPGEGENPSEGAFPLSHGQLSLWLAHRMAPESPVYNLALAARVQVDPEDLRRALERLAARHAVLRTTYPLVAGAPVQRIGEDGAVDFAVLDPAPGRLEEEAWRPFDLEHGPVMRVRLFHTPGEGQVLLLAVHHIAADFWSLGLLLEDLARLVTSEEVAPAPQLSYADWTRWKRERLAGPEGGRLWAEWQAALAGAPVVLDLPADRPRPPVPTHRGVSHAFSLGPELSDRVRALAAAQGTTLYAVLLAAFAALLHRHTGREDMLVGTAAAGRTRPGLEEVVGHFVSLLPVRADLAGDPEFSELLALARHALVDALERQDFPFPLLVERLAPTRDPARHPLVQAALVLEQPHRLQGGAAAPFVLGRGGAPLRVGGLVLEPVALPRPATPFDLTLLAVETGGTVEAVLELSADLFDPPTAARLAGRFLTLLASAAADPSLRLSELPTLTGAERSQLLVEWNDTASPAPERCAHELFEDWADRNPEAPALIGADGLARTYRELEERANRLARHLRSLGVGPESPVALHMERSPDLWTAALATLKAGGYYVPVDPSWPRERVDLVLADCGARAVVTADTLAGLAGYSAARLTAGSLPDNTAYGLYTSGSTGTPKGVLVPHRPLVNLVHQAARELRGGPGSRVLQVGSPVFDASVLEVFLALTSGAALCLASEEARLSGPPLAAEMRDRGITWAVLTPAAARFLPEEDLPTLETLVVGGEALPGSLVTRWAGRLRLFNGYGPAEAAVYVARHLCRPGDEDAPPIGRPIPNARLYVLGPWSREPLPPGAAGELHIGGVPPARGYFGRPGLTAERWVPDPFGGPGDRLYRTGDRVRWRPDGRLDFLGRIDSQVKLRGVRIEPGEIEAALARHPHVRETVVAARPGAAGEPVLVAYVVPRGGEEDLAGELRAFLAGRLPAALVPTAFVTLPVLPMTAVGKVDLGALPPPPSLSLPSSGGSAAALPRTDMERTVAAVWREVLGIEEVGMDRNFFELGGHSLLLAQVHARLCQVLGKSIPMGELFSHTTVSSLAARLSGDRKEDREDAREIHDRAAARRAAMDRRRARGRA